MHNRWRSFWAVSLLLAVTLLCFGRGASAQGNQRPAFVAGELLISVPAGTPRADVQTMADQVRADIVYAFGAVDYEKKFEAYHLRLREDRTQIKTLEAVNTLKQNPRIHFAGPNPICYSLQAGGGSVPNDPRFGEQWDKIQINMPLAWSIEKGKANVVIIVIDSGVDVGHPEFANRTLPGLNTFRQNNDPNPVGTTDAHSHGTHVAGIALAQANNGEGIAGVTWENVRLLPINAADDGGLAFPGDSLLRAWQYSLAQRNANPNLQYVMNLSLGGDRSSATPDLTDPLTQALIACAQSGMVIVAGAGNGFQNGNPPFWPALLSQAHPNILCVTATNHLGLRASYSQVHPYTTIAAPGGDVEAGRLILSTYPRNSATSPNYGLAQGTSMATPQVSGAAALLLSIPGVSAGDVRGVLTSTARPVPGFSVPSPEFGAGIVDVYAALQKVAVFVTIAEPQGTGGKAGGGGNLDPIETLNPVVRIEVGQILRENLTLRIDGGLVNISDANIENVRARDNQNRPTIYDVVIRDREFSPGQHRIEVTGVKPGSPDLVVSDTRNITITPRVLTAGRSMISIPYFQSLPGSPDIPDPQVTPEYYLGADFRLARWVPELQQYAFYTSFGVKDPNASFAPPGPAPRVDGETTPRYPLGLAFWSDVESIKPILTRGKPLNDKPFIIPLRGTQSTGGFIAWNMVGNPFTFDVPFNTLMVETPEGRLSIANAVQKGYLLPNIYTYDGALGYAFRTLPDGLLRAWTGHWIGVTSPQNISLVVPPTRVSRSGSLPNAPAVGSGGWSVRISASVRDLRDTYNFIGVSSRAAKGYDLSDVAKPPMVAPYVSVGVDNSDWGRASGIYAQDLRAPGSQETWNLVVNTDQANSDVLLNWSGTTLPRNLKLTIKDEATGQVVDMRTRNSLSFRTGPEAVSRKFTITARPSNEGSVVRISNIVLRSSSGRASAATTIGFTLSGDATYEVKILGASGNVISTVATRAASAGDVRLVWNGRDSGGRNVSPGTYLVQIRAVSPDGEVVRAIQPFTLVR